MRIKTSKMKWVVISLSIVIFLSGVAIGSYFYAQSQQVDSAKDFAAQTKKFGVELKEALIESCETNGNPLREVLKEAIEEEIKSSEDFDTIEELLPQTPKYRLEEIVNQQVEKDEERLNKVQPIDCIKQYP